MAAAPGSRENLALLQPCNSHEIAFLPSLNPAAGIDQRIGSVRLGTPSLGAVCRAAKFVAAFFGAAPGAGTVDMTQRFFIAMTMTGAIGFVVTGGWIWLFG
jgi:hypothetical protein